MKSNISTKILIFFCLLYLTLGLTYIYLGPIRTFLIQKQYEKYKTRIVISMTTTPYRINKIKQSLVALKQQSLSADKIYLNIPYVLMRDGTEYNIPDWLKNMDGIEITRCQDYGPGTKLIPTLAKENNPNTLIITVDDDVIYSKHLVRDLYAKSSANPTSIITGTNITCDISLDNCTANFQDGSQSMLAVGANGVAYRRSFFKEDFLDFHKNLPLECKLADDLLFSVYAFKNSIDIIQNGEGIYNPIIRLYPGALYHNASEYHYASDALSKGANGVTTNGNNYKTCLKFLSHKKPEYFRAIERKSSELSKINNIYSLILDTGISSD